MFVVEEKTMMIQILIAGTVDNLNFSYCSSVERVRLYSSRSKLTTGCFRLNRASQVQQSCCNRKNKQIIYITRAFKICMRISFFSQLWSSQQSFLNEHDLFNQPELVLLYQNKW